MRREEVEASRKCLVVRHLAGQTAAPSLQTPADPILLALNRAARRRRILALGPRLHLFDKVSGPAATNVVDGGLLAAQRLLQLEFLVEAEHGAFFVRAHVAGTTTTGGKVAGGRRRSELDAGCWASSCAAVGDLRGLDASYIAGTAATRIEVGFGGGVRLGDVKVDHFDCSVLICCVMKLC